MKTGLHLLSHTIRTVRKLGLMAMLGLAAASAQADIYGYIDADGNAHFAAAALDARYTLFMRGNGAFDSDKIGGTLPSPAGAGKSSGKSAKRAGSQLLNYLATHPNLKKYETMVSQAASEFMVEPALLKAIMAAESGFNPNAVSPKGAIGLMQIMPATAQRYGMQADKNRSLQQKLTDPALNIRLAAHYLRDLKNLFPQRPELAIASYNAGEGAVQKYRNQIPPYPETQNYVQLVTQFYRLYSPNLPSSPNVSGSRIAMNGSGSPTRVTMILPGVGRRKLPSPSGESAFE